MILVQWIVLYAVPAAASFYLKDKQTVLRKRVAIMYIGVFLSTLLMLAAGVRLTWHVSALSLIVAALGVITATWQLGRIGAFYAVGAATQQVCILLAGTLLASGFGIAVAASATSLVFTLVHRIVGKEWTWKLPLIFLWGCASIILYEMYHDSLSLIGAHAAFGSVLIRHGLLLTYREPSKYEIFM